MRKALVGLMIAATALTPVAASAQDRGSDRNRQRVERQESRAERAQQRSQARVERREQRQAQPRAQVQQRVQPQVRQQVQQQRERFQPQVRQRTVQPQQQVQRNTRADRFVQTQRAPVQRAAPNRTTDRTSWGGVNRSGNWSGRTYNWNRNGRTFSWNSDWRRDRRYDWYSYRNYNRSIYRLGSYYAPYRGYSYRRFSIGFFLQPLFYSSSYWIGDPWQYRLPPAYPGTRWVRYYDDVLLVDMYSGEVIDVIYNFFW